MKELLGTIDLLIACWILYDSYKLRMDKLSGPWGKFRWVSWKMHPLSWFFFAILFCPITLIFYVIARAKLIRGDLV
jgi:hypothetical protein